MPCTTVEVAATHWVSLGGRGAGVAGHWVNVRTLRGPIAVHASALGERDLATLGKDASTFLCIAATCPLIQRALPKSMQWQGPQWASGAVTHARANCPHIPHLDGHYCIGPPKGVAKTQTEYHHAHGF